MRHDDVRDVGVAFLARTPSEAQGKHKIKKKKNYYLQLQL